MKSIMITAPSSNTGKTTTTLGIIRAMKDRGLDVGSFKTGPDFIDTRYLEVASGKRAGNLDIHLMTKEGIKDSLSINHGKYVVVEGAMGYFDGIYNTFENSSFDISRELNIPALLVYTPKGEMFSAIPKIKGMVEFSNSQIKGVILNKVTEKIYLMLKEKIEEHMDIKVLGYMPYDVSLEVESRYLGLKQVYENPELDELINLASKMVESTIDIDEIINIMGEIDISPYKYPEKRNVKVAIAYDEAFNFYYNENLNLLENICKVEYFSPIRDKKVPQADLIYIGGGYPELYKEELSLNIDILNSMRENAISGKHIIAEAGGLMYLMSSIEDYPMCNIFKGQATMTNRLQRFGYVNILLEKDTLLGKKGIVVSGNEYHRSTIDTKEGPILNISKPKDNRTWQCGYEFENVLGYYQHINFLGNMECLNYLLDMVENKRKEG